MHMVIIAMITVPWKSLQPHGRRSFQASGRGAGAGPDWLICLI
jgi:hypothetical protein